MTKRDYKALCNELTKIAQEVVKVGCRSSITFFEDNVTIWVHSGEIVCHCTIWEKGFTNANSLKELIDTIQKYNITPKRMVGKIIQAYNEEVDYVEF